MNESELLLALQAAMLARIIADETWLEGERRGHAVNSTDPVVVENVCLVVLRMGGAMRAEALRQIAAERQARVGMVEEPVRCVAA